jgi:Zinc knuckle
VDILNVGLSLTPFQTFFFFFSISILLIIWSCWSPHIRMNLQYLLLLREIFLIPSIFLYFCFPISSFEIIWFTCCFTPLGCRYRFVFVGPVFRKFVFPTPNFGFYFIIEFCYLIALREFYGDDSYQYSRRLGPLMDETAVTILMEGLYPSLSGFVQSALRSQKTTLTNVLQEAELVYSSVQASKTRAERAEDLQHSTLPAKATMISSARGLPTYPRNYCREVAPVLAIEPEPYDPYPDWMMGQHAEVEHDPDDWDFVGGNVEQVLLAQMVQPQMARYCYTCWKPGHFSAECPLIPDSERAAIALRRAAVLKLRPPRFTRPPQPYPQSYAPRPIPESEKPPTPSTGYQPEVETVSLTVSENLKPVEERTRPPRSH